MIEKMRAELMELTVKIDRIKKIDSMLQSLQNEEQELIKREQQLKAILVKEEADVERLEKVSITSVMYSILGTKGTQIDKEQQEAYAAKLKYKSLINQLNDCRMRIEQLEREKSSLASSSVEYDQIFDKLQKALLNEPAYASQLSALEQQRGKIKNQLKELDEAIAAGNAALVQIDSIESKLKSAEGWGTFDLIGGGLITHIAKHSHLDEAQAGAEQLQVLLSRFRTELADVNIDKQMTAVNIEGFLRFADWFFDGLFADWSVLNRIHDSQNSIRKVKEQVMMALNILSPIQASYIEEMSTVEKQIAEIVTNGGKRV